MEIVVYVAMGLFFVFCLAFGYLIYWLFRTNRDDKRYMNWLRESEKDFEPPSR